MYTIATYLLAIACSGLLQPVSQADPEPDPMGEVAEPAPQSREHVTIELRPGACGPVAPPELRFTARVTAEDLAALLEMPELPMQFRLEGQRRATLEALKKISVGPLVDQLGDFLGECQRPRVALRLAGVVVEGLRAGVDESGPAHYQAPRVGSEPRQTLSREGVVMGFTPARVAGALGWRGLVLI